MQNRYHEARKIFGKIASTNQKSLNYFVFEEEIEYSNNNKIDDYDETIYEEVLYKNISSLVSPQSAKKIAKTEKKQKKLKKGMRYRDLFKNSEMRTISLILSYANFSLYICYYGMIFALPTIGSNPYITALILGTSELIAYLVSNIIVTKVNRKVSFPTVYFLIAMSCVLFYFFSENAAMIALASISKFTNAIAFTLFNIYTNELYPSQVRSLGNGIVNFIGKFGSAFAPILILLADTIRIHPMVLFGLFNGITVFLVLSLRETRGKKLLDYIGQQVEDQQSESSSISSIDIIQEEKIIKDEKQIKKNTM